VENFKDIIEISNARYDLCQKFAVVGICEKIATWCNATHDATGDVAHMAMAWVGI